MGAPFSVLRRPVKMRVNARVNRARHNESGQKLHARVFPRYARRPPRVYVQLRPALPAL